MQAQLKICVLFNIQYKYVGIFYVNYAIVEFLSIFEF